MDESTHRRLDLGIKIVTATLAVVGVAVGLWKYFDTAEKEFRRPYWERQVSLYFDATSAAAVLAASDDTEARGKAEARFWELYWGPLALVEDRQVEAAMVEFGDCLTTRCPRAELQRLSLRLAHTCRRSLAASWNLKLEELAGRGGR